MIPVGLALLLCAAPRAQDEAPTAEPWYVDQPVGFVSLEAVDGGLPGENLEPLLNVRQGDRLDPYAVRGDLVMLHRVGQFASVEAHVEPWVAYDEQGEPVEAVGLTYRVRPPPRVRRLRVEGARALGRREVEAASGLGPQDPFYEAQDAAVVAERVRAFCARSGFPQAEVEVVPHAVDSRRLDLELVIDEGPPEELAAVHFIGLPEGYEAAARRLQRRAGLRVGRRFRRGDLGGFGDAVEALLRRRGFPEAEVRVLGVGGDAGQGASVTLSVRAGRRVEVDVEGVGLQQRRALAGIAREQLAGPLSDEIVAEASALLAAALQRDGWRDASVAVTTEEQGLLRRVRVSALRGPRYVLADMHFDGAEAFDQRYLADALREASPEVLGRGHVTEEEEIRALGQVVEFYRSQGYLDARMTPEAQKVGEPGARGRVPVSLTVRVEEGPRTTLAALDLEGEPCDGAQAVLDGAAGSVGAPLDPSAMDRLARAVAEACWDEGYLDADVTVRRDPSPSGGAARVAFVVDPGPQVILRNVIIQGQRHTRRRVIEEQVVPETGEPITRAGMIATRTGLYDLGLFRRVETELLGDEDRVKDLLVDVEELPRLAVELGGGGSTDQGVRAFLRATHRNLWGTAHRLAFLGQAGLGYEGDSWRLDATQPEWRAGLRYEAPNLPGDGQRSYLDLVLNEQQQHGTFRLSRTGGSVGVRAPVGVHGELSMDYRLEWRWLEDVDPGALLVADPWLPLLGLPSSPGGGDVFDPSAWGEPDLPSGSRLSSGPGFLLVSDARDDQENPRRGMRLTLQARIEDGVLSSVPFLITRSHVQTLLPLGPVGLLLGMQAGLGQALEAGATLPIEERFALGGAGSLRGFNRESVGPRNRISAYDPGYPEQIAPVLEALRESDPWRWVSTGGDAMVLGTVELKVPLPVLGLRGWPDAALVTFADVGNAFLIGGLAETTTTQLGGEPFLRTGVGAGLRYATAVGPLQLDLGFNPWFDEERDEALVRLHLSLGAL